MPLHRRAKHEFLRVVRDHRPADRHARLAQAVRAHRALDHAGRVGRGVVGHEADHAAGRVGPEGPRLGPAQHLDLTRVKGAADRADAGEVEVVHQDTHRRVGRLALELRILADAADLKIARPRGAAGVGEVRDLVHQVAEVAHAVARQLRAFINAHARGDFFQGRPP